ncbi:hypothetical protein D3C81_1895310 [compost metagenome]
MVHQAVVTADDFAVGGLDLARLCRQVLLEEVAEAALADKADTGGVFLLRRGQAVFLGDGAYFGFFQFADRE